MASVTVPENKFAAGINHVIETIGRWSSVLNVILIAAIIVQVVLRYGFRMGLVQLEELQWHLYAVNVVFGMAYCQTVNSHIRLDIIHDKFSQRTKEWIEIFGIIFC